MTSAQPETTFMGVILRSKATKNLIFTGSAEILRGVYPEPVEGLRMTWMVLPAAICLLPPETLSHMLHLASLLGTEETLRPIHHNQNSSRLHQANPMELYFPFLLGR